MREYSVKFQNVTVAGATTLVIINPPATRVIEIVRCWCSQEANATSAQVAIELDLKASAFGTYTSATPQKVKGSDPASGITGGTAGAAGTSGTNASAEGAGALTLLYPDSFNALQGWLWTPSFAGGESYIVSGADSLAFVMKFRNAPATLSGWTGGVTFRELG